MTCLARRWPRSRSAVALAAAGILVLWLGATALAQEEGAPAEPEAAAVQRHLEEQDYRKRWPVWPGHRFAPSARHGPHAELLTVFLNPTAFEAIRSGVGSMPEGSMIVKESYDPDRSLLRVSVMLKAPGYWPEHRDWFWLELGPDAAVLESGRLEVCAECHTAARANDSVMTGPISDAKQGRPPHLEVPPPESD